MRRLARSQGGGCRSEVTKKKVVASASSSSLEALRPSASTYVDSVGCSWRKEGSPYIGQQLLRTVVDEGLIAAVVVGWLDADASGKF